VEQISGELRAGISVEVVDPANIVPLIYIGGLMAAYFDDDPPSVPPQTD
jgi:hypothetical protein